MCESQSLRAKYVVYTLPTSDGLRPMVSNLIIGMNLADKVTPSYGGIGL